MDDTRLRRLEKQFKLRVKTGCGTCRIRRVKCDEVRPSCERCKKSGRTCEGYVTKSRKGTSASAASYRNSSFLVVPQTSLKLVISSNPPNRLSPDPKENRSFHFFRTHTLPRWTEFFDSDLWSKKVLQLSHTEPAIKHGVLALSSLHERFEYTASGACDTTHDFAFVQYMSAVKRSNELLSAYQRGAVDLETVLMACIIFTCYENLAGNYTSANMHLRNGLKILDQHKFDTAAEATQESIGHVLYRFDLQAMTFSDNSSPYLYDFINVPECPQIPDVYTKNSAARNDLVRLLRCMLWVSGVVDLNNEQIPDNPKWAQVYSQIVSTLEKWEATFADYLQNIPFHEQADSKIAAGNSLLHMYGAITRILAASGAGMGDEMAWDACLEDFRSVVGVAETLLILQPRTPSASAASTTSPRSAIGRAIAPAPYRDITPYANTISSTIVFRSEPSTPSSTQDSVDGSSVSHRASTSFSPSFELSPIVPLFLCISKCRDPLIRRRALVLLLNYRRREGVWDSFGAAMVAAECLKREENLEGVEIGPDNWLPLSPIHTESSDVPEWNRVKDVLIGVRMEDGEIDLTCSMTNGVEWDRSVPIGGMPTAIVSMSQVTRY